MRKMNSSSRGLTRSGAGSTGGGATAGAVHAFASCATREQRAVIHDLELVAFALFFAAVLVQNKIKFGVYLPGLKRKNKRRVTSRRSSAL